MATSRPHSSRVSRRHASQGDSPISTTPPGIVQPPLYVGFRMSSRPLRPRNRAPAEAGMAGRTNAGSGSSPALTSLMPIMLDPARLRRTRRPFGNLTLGGGDPFPRADSEWWPCRRVGHPVRAGDGICGGDDRPVPLSAYLGRNLPGIIAFVAYFAELGRPPPRNEPCVRKPGPII